MFTVECWQVEPSTINLEPSTFNLEPATILETSCCL
jgi:hypothetical protein